MASINTNDWYVKDYCEKNPHATVYLQELVNLKNEWFYKYGIPQKGDYETAVFDINSKVWFKKVKAVQIDLLREFKRVCDKHGIRLYLIYGSLLGAVRSGGMIDGDDDIDIALMRQDYDKLVQLTSEFKQPYFLQNNYNENCFFGGYMKFRNAETTAIDPQNWYVNCCEGIFIDIFPIDKGYNSKIKEFIKLKRIKYFQRLLFAKSYGFFARFRDMPLFVWKFYKYWGMLFPRKVLLDKLNAVFRAGDPECKKLGIYTHYGDLRAVRYVPADAFGQTCTMTYEDMELLAPKDWDAVLFSLYGKGYLLPVTNMHSFHAFYKADVPYQSYKKRFTTLFTSHPDKNKDLIFVGDKELLEEYQKRFPHTAYKPKKFFDTHNLDAITEYSSDSTHIVIGAFDFLTLEETIRTFGFRDYSIYVYNRDLMRLPDLRLSREKYLLDKGILKNV